MNADERRLRSRSLSAFIGVHRRLILIWSLALSLASCGSTPPNQPPPSGAVMKIAVYSDGRLTIDGAPSTIEALTRSLPDLKARGGMIWYYREAAASEPHPVALDVIRAVAEAQLPIWMSTRPDYSDGRMASPK